MQLGAAVHIQVSNGKAEPVIVPRVTGLTEKQAVKILEAAGLLADVAYLNVQDPSQVGIVLSQVPIGSKEVDPNTPVTITVGRTPEGGGTGTTGATGPSG
jgi:beta-lactam-binding protein with PASTA domain